MKASDFFTPEGRKAIETAIAEAEKNTSGEIRVHVETSFKGNILDHAAATFEQLNMHKTELRNGVLIYMGIKNRQFAILGDIGINKVVPEGFWDQISKAMGVHFQNGQHAEGLVLGIKMAGEHLQKYFPCCEGDVNELSNEISFDTSE